MGAQSHDSRTEPNSSADPSDAYSESAEPYASTSYTSAGSLAHLRLHLRRHRGTVPRQRDSHCDPKESEVMEELSDMELESFTGGKNPNQRKCLAECALTQGAACALKCGSDTNCLEACAISTAATCAAQCANVSRRRRGKG